MKPRPKKKSRIIIGHILNVLLCIIYVAFLGYLGYIGADILLNINKPISVFSWFYITGILGIVLNFISISFLRSVMIK